MAIFYQHLVEWRRTSRIYRMNDIHYNQFFKLWSFKPSGLRSRSITLMEDWRSLDCRRIDSIFCHADISHLAVRHRLLVWRHIEELLSVSLQSFSHQHFAYWQLQRFQFLIHIYSFVTVLCVLWSSFWFLVNLLRIQWRRMHHFCVLSLQCPFKV